MNIPEKLAEAVARQDWQLVSDVHESLTGQALDLLEDRSIGAEIIEGLEGYLDLLKRGEATKGTLVVKEQISAMKEGTLAVDLSGTPEKKKKKTKRKKKTTQKVMTIDENLSDPVVDEADLYEPERGGHIEAIRGGKVKVDRTKTELITCEINEEERAANAKKPVTRKQRKKYQEFKYKCYKCNAQQKSPTCLSAESIKSFMCDECGKGVIRRS